MLIIKLIRRDQKVLFFFTITQAFAAQFEVRIETIQMIFQMILQMDLNVISSFPHYLIFLYLIVMLSFKETSFFLLKIFATLHSA
jgi:hypothetical protein